jgi:DNA-binding NarL/FixJ family response regulator
MPDIVITDINMPEMDGIQLLNSIAAIKPDARVIVITAHSDKQIYDRIASAGISAEIIQKPIVFETLMTAVKRFTDFIT